MSTTLPTTMVEFSIPKHRWHTAFLKIRCYRTLLSHWVKKKLPISLTKNTTAKADEVNNNISRSLCTLVNVELDRSSVEIDQTSLIKLVKKKNLYQLLRTGGVKGVASAVNCDVKNGIKGDKKDITCRQEAYGLNSYRMPPATSLFHFVLKAFKDPVIIMLVVCAALSLGFGNKRHGLRDEWVNGGSIFLAVFLVITVSSVSKVWPNRQFNKISKVSDNVQVNVVRNGQMQQIAMVEIVVGDVVCLRTEAKVPADGLLIDGRSLLLDESILTGEIDPVEVNSIENPFLLSGSKVVEGDAQMLVTSVGMNTTWGEIMTSTSRDSHESTPLQAQLNTITSLIGIAGLAVAFLVLVVWFVRYFTGKMKDGNGHGEFVWGKTEICDVFSDIVGMLATAVAIASSAVAEGLPLAVAITVAYSAKSMMNNQALVRKFSVCEAIVSATTICAKLNQMEVTKFWLGKESIIEGASSLMEPNVKELLHQAIGLNTSPPPSKTPSFFWTPMERAIIRWATQVIGMNPEELKECTILHGEAFHSAKELSGFLMKYRDKIHVHWKGTPEAILAMCSQYYEPTGTAKAMNKGTRAKLEEIVQVMAADGLQGIAFAHKQIFRDHSDIEISHHKDCLTLLGLVGVKDPCQPRVRKAIEECQHAGVNIKMITRDDVFIARSIATECGILKPNQDMNGDVVEGVDFQNYTQDERMEKVDKIQVMARASPCDELIFVQCLQQKGHVVAVTGNDTADAPVLRESDISLCMGFQAPDVTKESSDIVIMDDGFVSVVTVMKWGRTMYNHIQIFTQFQLTASIASLVIDFVTAVSAGEPPAINMVAAISEGEVPFAAIQLLWVKLIMGTLAALALTIGQPTKDLMEKPPVDRTEPLITKIMWRNILAQAMYHIAVILILQFKGKAIFGVNEKVKDTLVFNTFVLCQVFSKFNARELEKMNIFKGIHRNKLFLGIIGIIIILQVVMVEFLKRFAHTERLNWKEWGATIVIAAISWPLAWCVKWIPIPNKPFLSYLKWKN